VRRLGEIAAVVVLAVTGMLLGAATPWFALSPVLGMLLPLCAATLFLRREGRCWRDLGFPRAMPLGRFLGLSVGTFVFVTLLGAFVLGPLLRWFGAPPVQLQPLIDMVEGDLATYLVFLFPIVWGSAAFGEELLLRGFVFDRLETLCGTIWAVPLQAGLFALGHAYQGITGVVNIFVVGLVLGLVYLRAGRNLWPVIAAHGFINTFSITLVYLGYGELATGP
jgi:membrane protease YdiL (CAAX protease family)